MKSWKTTLFGLAAALAPIAAKIWPQYAGEILQAASILAGLGLMAARDNSVTSEQAGAKVTAPAENPNQGKLPGVLTLLLCASVAFSCIVPLTGCKSPQQTAYVATATVTGSVDAAMNIWGDYVRAGLAAPGDEALVRKSYGDYQVAVRLARSLALSYETADPTETALRTALEAVADSSSEIIALIQHFTTKETP